MADVRINFLGRIDELQNAVARAEGEVLRLKERITEMNRSGRDAAREQAQGLDQITAVLQRNKGEAGGDGHRLALDRRGHRRRHRGDREVPRRPSAGRRRRGRQASQGGRRVPPGRHGRRNAASRHMAQQGSAPREGHARPICGGPGGGEIRQPGSPFQGAGGRRRAGRRAGRDPGCLANPRRRRNGGTAGGGIAPSHHFRATEPSGRHGRGAREPPRNSTTSRPRGWCVGWSTPARTKRT